jgi:hypothetical protein
MHKRILTLGVLALAVVFASATAHAQRDRRDRGRQQEEEKAPWIHVEVTEEGEEGAKVTINLPLSLAKIALEMAPEEVLEEGRIEINDTDLTVEDLRRIWTEVREAGDAEFVTVEEEGETIRVYRQGDRLFVKADGEEGQEKIRVEVPVALVDALLSGSGEELNLDAAMAELQKMDSGEIVRVEDNGDLVRIWVD